MKYTLLIDSTRGRAGDAVEIDEQDGETIAILIRNGIIAPHKQMTLTDVSLDLMGNKIVTTKVVGPELTKVIEPEVKKRGRPAKDASHTTQ